MDLAGSICVEQNAALVVLIHRFVFRRPRSCPPSDDVAHDHVLVLVDSEAERMVDALGCVRGPGDVLGTSLDCLSCQLIRHCSEGNEAASTTEERFGKSDGKGHCRKIKVVYGTWGKIRGG